MKNIFTICCLVIAHYSFAQTTFRTAVNTPGNTYINDLIQLKDGSFVGVGNFDDDHLYIIKLNSSGQLITSKTIAADIDATAHAIVQTSDGGFAVTGWINEQMSLLRFDANTNLLWHKAYTAADISNSASLGLKLLQTSDGGYLIAGYLAKIENAGLIIRTDSTGNVRWSKQYFDMYFNIIRDIKSTKDGNYVFVASAGSNSPASIDTTYLIKIDTTGNILWSKYIMTNLDDQFPRSFLSAPDGSIVVCGTIRDTGISANDSRLMLLKFDESGNIVWSKASDIAVHTRFNYLSIVRDNDDSYDIAGALEIFDSTQSIYNSQGYLLKIDNKGTLQQTRTVTSPGMDTYFYNLITTNDEGYATAGRLDTLNENNDYTTEGIIYKLDAGLNICGNAGTFGNLTDLLATVTSDMLKVYDINMVPVNDKLVIHTTGTAINLCNVLPTQLLSFNATLQNKTVNVHWKTANEINTNYFIVERSNNATAFKKLQQVKAAGNSSGMYTYQITDAQPLFGTSYYRLKEVDKDGSFTYSSIVSVKVNTNGTIVISPNPVQYLLHVELQSSYSSKIMLQITDVSGRMIINQQTYTTAGTNQITIPAASLGKGMYILKVIQKNNIQAVKFIKQ